MTRDDEGPSRTACALGERADPNREPELDQAERARIEHAALLAREVLRATDVAGLDAAMRAQIAARAARRRPFRSRRLVLASSLGGALMVALTLFLAVVRPAQERAVLAERARVERVQAEREAEARRVEREARARRAEFERAQAKRAAEQAARLSAAEAARAEAARTKDAVRVAPAARAKPASRASSASAGGCDPNDALCGL